MDIIKYKEKEYPVKVGYYALKHTSKEVKEKHGGADMSMDDILGADIEVYEPLLYHSLVMGAKIMDKPLDLGREDMEFILDSCLVEFTDIVTKSFPSPKQGETKTVIP